MHFLDQASYWTTSPDTNSSFVAMDQLTLAPLSWARHATRETRLPSIPEILRQPYGLAGWKPSAMPKRPRRRFHEVERKYGCRFPGCGKAYGALNHLNAHIVSRSHGRRRKAREFGAN